MGMKESEEGVRGKELASEIDREKERKRWKTEKAVYFWKEKDYYIHGEISDPCDGWHILACRGIMVQPRNKAPHGHRRAQGP